MFRILSILLLSALLAACSGSSTGAETEAAVPAATAPSAPEPAPAPAQNDNLLCLVNGKPWHYTKASGVVTTDRKTEERTALITYKRKLDKGSESIQLYYDAGTLELQKVSAQLKFPKAGGGQFGGIYELSDESHLKKLPGSSMEGTIDLSAPGAASGTATIMNIGIRFEKEELANPEDAVVSITDLQFSGVGYSDLAKVKKKLNM